MVDGAWFRRLGAGRFWDVGPLFMWDYNASAFSLSAKNPRSKNHL